MNEDLNLAELLKDCPNGTKLYSTVHGEVTLINVDNELNYPIVVRLSDNTEESFTSEGKLLINYDGECTLVPSRWQRDWCKFAAPWYKKEKFDPKTLKAFDKVLVRSENIFNWNCSLFSNIDDFSSKYPFSCLSTCYRFCIPYNDETKHLVGTNNEAPEYYRYWED